MSAFIFRFALGVLAAALLVEGGALEAAAQDRATFNTPPQDYSSERASPPGAENYNSYVADPAESYVVEGDEAPAEIAAPRQPPPEPPHQQYREPYREAYQAPLAAVEPRWQQREPAPYCRAYFPVGPGRDRSGTLCEQSDGALRIVKAPALDMRRGIYAAASSQYCREYQQTVIGGGGEHTAFGKACWQRDGSWQIVSAPTLVVAAAPVNAPPARAYAPAPRAAERRLKLPEFYFGNLFGWLRPRDER